MWSLQAAIIELIEYQTITADGLREGLRGMRDQGHNLSPFAIDMLSMVFHAECFSEGFGITSYIVQDGGLDEFCEKRKESFDCQDTSATCMCTVAKELASEKCVSMLVIENSDGC